MTRAMNGRGRGDGWIRRLRGAERPTTRMLCLPPAGGTALFFVHLAQAIASHCEVVGVQYPGHPGVGRECGRATIHELADGVADAAQRYVDLPLALFGHGMGASVAFETAARLERRGVTLLALLASGAPAPSRHRGGTTHGGGDQDVVRSLAPIDPGVASADGGEAWIPTPALLGDIAAAQSYRWTPDTRVSCSVLAMVGDLDPAATVDEARAWGEVTSGQFELQVFSGGHFYLRTFVSTVANAVSEWIAICHESSRRY